MKAFAQRLFCVTGRGCNYDCSLSPLEHMPAGVQHQLPVGPNDTCRSNAQKALEASEVAGPTIVPIGTVESSLMQVPPVQM